MAGFLQDSKGLASVDVHEFVRKEQRLNQQLGRGHRRARDGFADILHHAFRSTAGHSGHHALFAIGRLDDHAPGGGRSGTSHRSRGFSARLGAGGDGLSRGSQVGGRDGHLGLGEELLGDADLAGRRNDWNIQRT